MIDLTMLRKALAAKQPADFLTLRFEPALSYDEAIERGVAGLDEWMQQSPEFALTVGQLAEGVSASAEPTPVKYRTIDRLNVRTEPSTSAAKVTILAADAEVWIGEIHGGWGRISQGEYAGRWLSVEYLTRV